MQAIILAGGFGTRLKSVVSEVPKPMAPVNGRPFLSYILDNLNKSGFQKVVIAVGYQKEYIMNFYKFRYKNIVIKYSIEDEPLGTGGCLKQAMEFIDDAFAFVLNGDTLFDINYKEMANSKTLSIACKEMVKFDRYGEVKFNHNQTIESFEEKAYVEKGYINGGIYYLPKNIFTKYNFSKKFSLEKDFFEKYVKQLNIKPFISNAYFLDIGIPEDYKKAQEDFKGKKALFLDRDGVINIDYGHVHTIDKFKFTNFIVSLCKNYQENDYLLFVVTNQAGIGKGLYPEEDVLKLHTYMKETFKDNGIEIEEVFYCPHKPEDCCECRKPNSGLFEEAIRKYRLDVKKSVVIGDKLSDLEAGFHTGIDNLYLVPSNYEIYPVEFTYEKLEV